MSKSESNVKALNRRSKEEAVEEEENTDLENYSTSPIDKDILDDQESLFEKTFQKSTFLNEKWDERLFIDGQVNKVTDNIILVNCLVDEENQIFKEKVFPKQLTNHIQDLNEKTFLRVKISFKSGSMRYDIYDAEGFNIDKEIFEADNLWDSLEDFEFDEPL